MTAKQMKLHRDAEKLAKTAIEDIFHQKVDRETLDDVIEKLKAAIPQTVREAA